VINVRARRAAIIAIAMVCALAGCTSTVAGSGQLAAGGLPPSGPSGGLPSGPSGGGGTNAPGGPEQITLCPHVAFPAAHLAFDCITTGLSAGVDLIWPLDFSKMVEPNWYLNEGARPAVAAGSNSLSAVAGLLRSAMLQGGEYGDSPKVATVADKAITVDGHSAHVLQSTITINNTYRIQQHLTVKVEKLWIVTVQVSAGQVAAWYVTIPDQLSTLWARVPSVIGTIKVS
jgi:hypothetical protein